MERPWIGRMTWNDLLFMHWRVPETVLRPLVPQALEMDRFDGEAWLGVIPFHMSDVRPRWIPSFLGLQFPELNVRTYVRYNGRAGVWFFSLDAANRLAVRTARRFFRLPYHFASMSTSCTGETVSYNSRRYASPAVQLSCRYRPTGPLFHSTQRTLEHWLTERYCLFAADGRDRIFRGDIHHKPWPLQKAEVEIEMNTMTAPLGITLPEDQPVLHFAKRLDVVAWSLE